MFGINGSEMLILVIVALVVVGPKRIPEYAQKLRDLVRQLRRYAEGAKESVQRDFGDDFKDVDWQKLDPRQYDPRRIVREALVEEDTAIRESKHSAVTSPASAADDPSPAAPALPPSPIERFQAQSQLRVRSEAAPFDSEAT